MFVLTLFTGSKRVFYGSGTAIAGLIAIIMLLSNPPETVQAAGIVTNCASFGVTTTVGDLANALEGGGNVVFNCSGSILIPNEITITINTSLNANGNNVTLNGGSAIRLFQVNLGTTLSLRGLTLSNGAASGNGGAINIDSGIVTVNDCTFSNHTATNLGGSIMNNSGQLTIVNSSFNNNTAAGGGGAIYSTGIVSIDNSTFSGNRANGLFGGGAIYNSSTLGVTTSTFSGNIAANGDGGAIEHISGTATVSFVTIASNSAPGGAGGGIFRNGGNLKLQYSIVGSNTASNNPDLSGTIESGGYNLIGNATGASLIGVTTGNIIGQSPNLAALANNGGTTQTMLPLLNSPAINGGNPDNTVCPILDQRGQSRPQGGRCDIGAVEVLIGAPTQINVVSGTTPQSAVVGTAFAINLGARVTDAGGYPVSGIDVVFTVNPVSGAGAAFGVSPSITITTGGNGIATASTLTANGIPGSYTVTANRAVTPFATPATFNLTNTVGPAVSFQVTGYPNPTNAGAVGSFVVAATDSFGNISTGYTGTVTFSSSDPAAVLPPNATLTAGVGFFNATLKTVGTRIITATDTVSPTIKGSQTGIVVNPALALSFQVTGYPNPTTAGVAHSFNVTATDAFGNTATSYSGIVTFSSSDPTAVLPPNATLTNGTGTFTATLKTAGLRAITATDTVASAVTGSQLNILVNPADPVSLNIVSGNGQIALINTAFAAPLVVDVRDIYSNTIAGVQVTFAVPSIGATAVITSLNPLNTGSNGQAAAYLTANAIKGAYNVTASATGLPSVNFSLTNGGPTFSSAPAPNNDINMGIIIFGSTLNYTLVISNTGSGTLNVSEAGGLNDIFKISSNAPFQLAAGASKAIVLQCTPPGVALYTTTLTFTSNDSNQTSVSYNVNCRGIAPNDANFFKTITPGRLYDSRPNQIGVPLGGEGPIATGEVRIIKAAGQLGIPITATGILANLTVSEAQGGGNLRAFPASLTDIDIASVNWYASPLPGARVVGNFAIIALDSNGQFKIKAQGSTNFTVDVTGYLVNIPTGAGVFKTLPSGINPRLYDSRPANATNTALLGKGSGRVVIGTTPRTIKVAGASSLQNIPATATGVVLNVTASNTKRGGYLTLYPANAAVPNIATVNWNDWTVPNTNIPRDIGNMAIVPLSPGGDINVIAGGLPDSGADLIIDVIGFIDEAPGATSGFQLPVSPQLRLYDSRIGQPVYAGGAQKGNLPAQNTRTIKGAGVVSVPANAKAVLVRVVTVDVGGGGYLALYPREPYPGNSTVNTNAASQQIGNLAIAELDQDGNFIVRNGSGAFSFGFVVDIVAYIV